MLTGVRRRFGCAPKAPNKAFTTEDTGDTEEEMAESLLATQRTFLPFSSNPSFVSSLSSVSPMSSVVRTSNHDLET
jgi:hypothetical protein